MKVNGTLACCLLLVLSLPAKAAMGIGPYRMGMTKKEVTKFGFYDCRKSPISIRMTECSGYLSGGPNNQAVRLYFDTHTNRITGITLNIEGVIANDPAIPGLLEVLKVEKCHPSMAETKHPPLMSDDCYDVKSGVSRSIFWRPGQPPFRMSKRYTAPAKPPELSVWMFHEPKAVALFLKRRAAAPTEPRKQTVK